MPKNVTGAMFDIRPVDPSGRVDVARTGRLAGRLNLRPKPVRHAQPSVRPTLAVQKPQPIPRAVLPEKPKISAREKILQELQAMFHGVQEPKNMFKIIGAQMQSQSIGHPRVRPIVRRDIDESLQHQKILTAINQPFRDLSDISDSHLVAEPVPEIPYEPVAVPTSHVESARDQMWLEDVGERYPQSSYQELPWRRFVRPFQEIIHRLSQFLPSRRMVSIFLLALVGTAGIYSVFLHQRVISEGNAAVDNLQSAKEQLKQLDFAGASEKFLNAYEEFAKAGSDLDVLGASISDFLANFPGGAKLKSARDLVQAGKLIAATGQSMSDAIKVVSKTGWVLNPKSNTRVLNAEILLPLKNALALSDKNITKAASLLATIDATVIPEDKRAAFDAFQAELPQFRELVGQAKEYAGFFEQFVGTNSTKKYLLLFENDTELRPTGGFPGTYGVMTIENGRVKDFFADDIYNLDGQLTDLYVPPVPLQHITPNWGMRDANWFVDFPMSAKKVMFFFRKEAGYDVDGVITIKPKILADILKVIGPISMPQYNLTLDYQNFLPLLQKQVEYGDDKKENKPKKIITELAPIVLEKLYLADKAKWLDAFNAFMNGMARKDILMYFRDVQLQDFVLKEGFSGQVQNAPGDFLMATFSNVKGAKSDAVTETALKLDTTFQTSRTVHTLTLTRRHNGGSSKYGFYNRTNPSYVRVLVPLGAQLIKISGNSKPQYQPLLNYVKTDFAHDEDLTRLESSGRFDPSTDVTTYQESGKTEFGFWMIIDPGEIKTVELQYTTPSSAEDQQHYQLYVQRQPGLDVGNIEISITPPDGMIFDSSDTNFRVLGDHLTYGIPLERDLPLEVRFK